MCDTAQEHDDYESGILLHALGTGGRRLTCQRCNTLCDKLHEKMKKKIDFAKSLRASRHSQGQIVTRMAILRGRSLDLWNKDY